MDIWHRLAALPPALLAMVISRTEPQTWWGSDSPGIRKIINTTAFRAAWACQLANSTHLPATIACIGDVGLICRSVLQPITELFGSEAWISAEFVRALKMNRPKLLNALAPGLLWSSLLSGRQGVASLVVQHSSIDLGMLGGALVREVLARQPALWILEWLELNGLDFADLYRREQCFDMSLVTQWVLASRVDLLQFLTAHGMQLPVRSLLDYALSNSSPEMVAFLMGLGAEEDRPTWNDLLLMACTEGSTRPDVFVFVAGNTRPGVVWTHGALCLAAHATSDNAAYLKFSALRRMPGAAEWMARSLSGCTPIQRLCDLLTYENVWALSPFIRDYIDLGVSPAGMPSAVAFICQ
ncbi:hypothetical protein GQ54DRAFT_297646 [Martensiomyces pterosporus]|nr:hypothetical protein GQ54DRAFT_297646 [Martensiomyces pterosporus]